MTPQRYSVSTDNIMALKKYKGKAGHFSPLLTPSNLNLNCRMMGPVEAADNMTIGEFITKAFNDEFKMSELYDAKKAQISGRVTKATFSSVKGLTGGYWDLAIELTSTSGAQLNISSRYDFKSGFDAITACNATADALTPAVQDLIHKTITAKEFSKLLN